MVCPKCEEGEIKKIKFKETGMIGFLCDYCDALWLEGERIAVTSNRTLRSYTRDEDLEYSIEELDEKDQEHQPLTTK